MARKNYKECVENLLKEHGLTIDKVLPSSIGLTFVINGNNLFAEDWARMYYFLQGYFCKINIFHKV